MTESSKPYTVRWGILATGWIAQTFAKDLLVDPSTRSVDDVAHTIVAAASSTSQERASQFLKDVAAPDAARAYGSYKELVADADVDIVYVATPHSHHYQNTRLALEAGKHVLCEKAFTTNALQARKLVEIAGERKLFLMEAVWTRYFPIARELRGFVTEGKIGSVKRVFADLSDGGDAEAKWGTEHRMVKMDLAGGAMLDLGIYSLTWLFQFLYHIQPAEKRKAPIVASSITKYPKTGCDEMTSMILTFPPDNTHGIATTNLRVSTNPDQKGSAGASIRIQGTLGEIQVFGPAYKPHAYRIIPYAPAAHSKLAALFTTTVQDSGLVDRPVPAGHGMHWEADEAARCVRDGRLESEALPWEESVVIMETMDEVRRQGGLVYPERIESLDYPLDGF